VVYLKCHETLNSAAMRPFGRCHPYLVCSKYLGAKTIWWKICSLFDQHILWIRFSGKVLFCQD